ncbi:ParA family protein [Quatrionicoccus australiensis]|uniref:ParA family protein n=1 Tax=Quatrionicoccus australiensis TaxID=138118 RepID=UPI001CFB2C0A|nr:ParA family protein [Quatrionicoccus australiensis]MCB4362049.1 ParA family protein [Quatrionicoccus australiensis]
MSETQAVSALRDPTFRGKFVCDALVWPSISLHILKKLTGKETGDGARHVYRPADVRKLKLAQYENEESSVNRKPPPVVNCRMAKGGTGKTTVAANLGTAFSFMGYKTLMIDADPQASLTNMMGIDASSEDITHIGHLMEQFVGNKGHVDVASAVRNVFSEGMLDIIPADITLTNADGWLMNQMQRETVFDRLLVSNKDFFEQYDVIVVDSAPGTSLLSMNIMVATRTQLAVCWLDRENLKALPILLGNVDEINAAYPNHASDVEIVANGYSAIYKQSKEALEVLVAKYPHQLNENVIQQFSGFHRQQALPGGECKGAVVEQDQSSPGAKAMLDLAKSLLGRYKITLAGFDESIPSTRGN